MVNCCNLSRPKSLRAVLKRLRSVCRESGRSARLACNEPTKTFFQCRTRCDAFFCPGPERPQRARVPPKRHDARSASLGVFLADQDVWPSAFQSYVCEPQLRNLRNPQIATAGQPYYHLVHSGVGRAATASLQIRQHGAQFRAGQHLGRRNRLSRGIQHRRAP